MNYISNHFTCQVNMEIIELINICSLYYVFAEKIRFFRRIEKSDRFDLVISQSFTVYLNVRVKLSGLRLGKIDMYIRDPTICVSGVDDMVKSFMTVHLHHVHICRSS